MEGFIGEIRLFGGNFAPVDWKFCNGQTLQISNNNALYSILGTMYGGDGQTTFQLPDLRGRFAVGAGEGLGLSNIPLGGKTGIQNISLTSGNMPEHSHEVTASNFPTTVNCHNTSSNAHEPASNFPGGVDIANNIYATTSNAKMANDMVTALGNTDVGGGSGKPVKIQNPFQGLQYIICVQGIYPSRK